MHFHRLPFGLPTIVMVLAILTLAVADANHSSSLNRTYKKEAYGQPKVTYDPNGRLRLDFDKNLEKVSGSERRLFNLMIISMISSQHHHR